MPLPPKTDREELFRILLERELVASTGIGEGIAIPHVRSPLIVRTETPLINLCLLEKAIDFNAIDSKPVHALFTMISPNARLHLHLISRLAQVLHDKSLKSLLMERAGDAEIMAALHMAESSIQGRGK
jgi:nitrogen PTS system EIIA component